jgi:hypothetical protein
MIYTDIEIKFWHLLEQNLHTFPSTTEIPSPQNPTPFQPFYHKNQQVSPSAPTLANPKSNINQPFGQ